MGQDIKRSDKQFKSIDEQISVLRSKRLIIDDEEETKEILLRENYFFVSGYRHVFMNSITDKTFITGVTFRELYSLFLFDRYFRNILFKNLLIVENQMKSILSYQMSKKYGYQEKDYLNLRNFTTDKLKTRRVRDVVDKMKRQIRINGMHHQATLHYINNYGYIPMWVLVKVLSFGIVCELYTILKDEDKLEIASVFGVSSRQLDIFLPILSNYRNLCAHEDIMFEHRTEKEIPDCEYHEKLGILLMDGDYIYGKNDMFSVVIMLKYLLRANEFQAMMREIEYEIEKLDGKIDAISIDKILDRMGFPKNYMDIIEL